MMLAEISHLGSSSASMVSEKTLNRKPLVSRKTLNRESPLRLISGSAYIPKDSKSKPLGEDAHFTCDPRNTMGVADGVGGWAKRGIDAGNYARLLIENASKYVWKEPRGSIEPKRVLERAFRRTVVQGSSTACIVTIRGNELIAANVGDSGFIVVRDEKVIYRSPVQQRGFNCPYQLGFAKGSDKPNVAEEIRVPVRARDIVILGTDGLFDNASTIEIQEIIVKIKAPVSPDELASRIARMAAANSVDEDYLSPFKCASALAGRSHAGGKPDDITVVVGFIAPF